LCDICDVVDYDATTRSNTKEQVFSVCSVDNTRLHVFLQNPAI